MSKTDTISSDDENSPVFNILKKWGPNFYHCCYLINFKKDNIHDVFKGLNMKMLLKPTPAILFGNRKISFYIVEGALGLPVFSGTPAKGIGIAYLFGPTGGYIFGFAFSALLAGILFSKKNYFIDNKNFLITFLKLIISLMPTYLIGLIWLGTIIGWNKPILELGFYPFLLGEIFKVSLLAILLQKFSRYRFF